MPQRLHGSDASGRVRVLHVVPQFRLGGMEQGIVKLANGLPPTRIATAICSFESEIDGIADSLQAPIAVHALGRRRGNDPVLVWRLVRLLRKERPAIVHSHGWGTLCETYIAARTAGVRYFVHSEHGTMELRRRNLCVQRAVWSLADRVLAVSSTLADRMARKTGFARERIQVIVNGADVKRFDAIERADARRCLDIAPGTFVIGTVGRLVPVKDQETLLGAVAQLRSSGVPCLALVAGDGPLLGALEARAVSLGIDTAVRFLGRRADVAPILAALDVFVLTSASEGLPNCVLEAMASGLPVVSTAVGGVREVVEEGVTGLLAAAGDVRRIADHLAMLAREPAVARQMGACGRARAREDFSLERMLERYERLYLDLAAPARGRFISVGASTSPCVESLAE